MNGIQKNPLSDKKQVQTLGLFSFFLIRRILFDIFISRGQEWDSGKGEIITAKWRTLVP